MLRGPAVGAPRRRRALVCSIPDVLVVIALGGRQPLPDGLDLLGVLPHLCGNQILRRVRAESPRRPPRHLHDICSVAWRCRFLIARRGQDGRVIAECECTRRTG